MPLDIISVLFCFVFVFVFAFVFLFLLLLFFFSRLLAPVVIDAKVMLFLWGKKCQFVIC